MFMLRAHYNSTGQEKIIDALEKYELSSEIDRVDSRAFARYLYFFGAYTELESKSTIDYDMLLFT